MTSAVYGGRKATIQNNCTMFSEQHAIRICPLLTLSSFFFYKVMNIFTDLPVDRHIPVVHES